MQKLPATYFGPVWWYSALLRGGAVIDCEENFQKQTLRNRCIINTSQGEQKLTIPVAGTSSHHQKMCDTLISDHGNWRHQHWQALQTAYGNTPFFEYYQDYLRPFYIDEVVIADSLLPPTPPQCRLTHLLDYDLATTKVVLQMIGASGNIEDLGPLGNLGTPRKDLGTPRKDQGPLEYLAPLRKDLGTPRKPLELPSPLASLSILDLLFNKGPETINYL